jgi:hypothetical protein
MCSHMHTENTPRNSFYLFRQQGNLLHFEDMLHNLCFIFHTMLFISYISYNCNKNEQQQNAKNNAEL